MLQANRGSIYTSVVTSSTRGKTRGVLKPDSTNMLHNMTKALLPNTFYNARTHKTLQLKTTLDRLKNFDTKHLLLDIPNSLITDLRLNNYKILYSNTNLNKNRLLLKEALFIKSYKPELNNGLKARCEFEKRSFFAPAQTTNPSQQTHTDTIPHAPTLSC